MSFETGTAASATDLLDKLNTFLLKGHTLSPVYTGTGNGLITGLIGTATSSQETITVTFSSASAFSVVGSVTGAMGSGTVGTLFAHAKARFTITAGGTAWANGDTIAFVMTPAWVQLRGVAGSEYIWRAPGNANLDQIIVGAQYFSNSVGGYYNWRLLGATGFDGGQVFASQPGSCSRPVLPLWDSTIPYWFIADGRRVIIIAKVTTVYEHAYLGFLDAYASPGEWAYPLMVGGSMSWFNEPAAASQSWKYSYVGEEHRPYWSPTNNRLLDIGASWLYSQARLRRPDGVWMGFTTNTSYAIEPVVYPYYCGGLNVQACLDGSAVLHPVFFADATPNVYGELAGVKAVSGVDRGSEDHVLINRDTYLVAQSIARTTTNSYAAFLLA